MLTETQLRGLLELNAASNESIRYGGSGWVQTRDICGTKRQRGASNMRSLIDLGFAEGRKDGPNGQSQWSFRITEQGRTEIQRQQTS